MCVCGGGVLRFFHAYVGSGHSFWFSEKNKYFLGHENFVDIFFESSQNWTIFRGHFYAF